jgi:VWFA-related protein
LPPNDRLCVVTDDVKVLVDFTTDRAIVEQKLDQLLSDTLDGDIGKSMQYSGLMAAVREKFGPQDLRPVVIIQTDGDQFMDLKGPNPSPRQTEFSYNDIIDSAHAGGVTIYTVNPGMSYIGVTGSERESRARTELVSSEQLVRKVSRARNLTSKWQPGDRYVSSWADARERDESAVARLAMETGGLAQKLTSPEEAEAVYSRILADIEMRYMIGYYPSNQARDGKRRSIRVALEEKTGYTLRYKSEYTAAEEPH